MSSDVLLATTHPSSRLILTSNTLEMITLLKTVSVSSHFWRYVPQSSHPTDGNISLLRRVTGPSKSFFRLGSKREPATELKPCYDL